MQTGLRPNTSWAGLPRLALSRSFSIMSAPISSCIAWGSFALAAASPMVSSGALRSSATAREAMAAMAANLSVNCSFGERKSRGRVSRRVWRKVGRRLGAVAELGTGSGRASGGLSPGVLAQQPARHLAPVTREQTGWRQM